MAQLTFILKVEGSPARQGVYKKRVGLDVIKLILNYIKFLLMPLGRIKFFINTAKLN
jgi:hypothetical protein